MKELTEDEERRGDDQRSLQLSQGIANAEVVPLRHVANAIGSVLLHSRNSGEFRDEMLYAPPCLKKVEGRGGGKGRGQEDSKSLYI